MIGFEEDASIKLKLSLFVGLKNFYIFRVEFDADYINIFL